ncbi:MAG: hypothetical protein U0414_19860 [Polyangiaceae bacterium]
MRRLVIASAALGSLATAGCTAAAPASTDEVVDSAQAPVSWGTPDGNAHPAVVALLIDTGGGAYEECSGSIVQQANGYGYVLTAAHCCAATAPTIVTTKNDYDAPGASAVNALFGGPLPAGVYKVDTTSVYVDPLYDANNLGAGHDFCMLKFSTTNTLSVLALPSATSDGLGAGTMLEHVGFGTTNTNPNNTLRNKGTGPISQLSSALIVYDQGGTPANHISGTCQGDSGGPALTTGSPQVLVGVTSFGGADAQGNPVPCGQSDQGGAGRVKSVIGAGKFVTAFLADMPFGNQPGTTGATCDACQQDTLSGGACASAYSACTNNTACNTLLTCFNNCNASDQTCIDNCWNAAGSTGQTLHTNIINCICETGCVSECASDPLCQPATGSCGFQSANMACDTCVQAQCCADGAACANDTTCSNCMTGAITGTACANNDAYKTLTDCLGTNCPSCGIGTSSSSASSSSTSSSSSGSASSSTSSSGGASSSSGTGMGGAGAGGKGAGGDVSTGGAPVATATNADTGCSVSGEGTGSSKRDAGSIALVVGAAITFIRRRNSNRA